MDDAGRGRRGLRPRVSAALIEGVEHSYGLSLSGARDIGGSANLNLLVRGAHESFVVRTYRRHVTEERLAAIQQARAHLAAGRVACVEAISAADGSRHVRVGENLVEVEPFVDADSKMDSLERVAEALPTLGRVHDLLSSADLGPSSRHAPFANFVDPFGLVAATRAGTDRIRSWQPTADETAIADAAERLAEAAAEAQEPFTDLRHQLVHGDYWDNNVLMRGSEVVLVGDFDFMAERLRVDDLALTLSFTTILLHDPLDVRAGRQLSELVDRYDSGTDRPLTATERAAVPVALARQSLWSITMWAANLDRVATARRHLHGHLPALQHGLAIISDLRRYQDALGVNARD